MSGTNAKSIFTPGLGLIALALAAFYIQRSIWRAALLLPERIGDSANYLKAATAILAGDSPYTVANFDYPPLAAVIVLPLALLPDLARVVWFVLGHLFLVAAAILLWRFIGRDRIAAVAIALVWCLGGTVAENLVLGQFNPLLLLLLVVAMVSGKRIGSAALGLATAIKIWPGLLVLAAFLRRRWRVFAEQTLWAIGLIVIPLVALVVFLPPPHVPASSGFWMGTPAILNFSLPAQALRLSELPNPGDELPRNWRLGSDPQRLTLSRSQQRLAVVVSLSALAICLGFIWRAVWYRGMDRLPLLAALVSAALVTATISWYHYQLLQFPGIAWLGSCYWRESRMARLFLLVGVTLGLTWFHAIPAEFVGLGSPAQQALYVLLRGALVPIFGLLLLTLYLQRAGETTRPQC